MSLENSEFRRIIGEVHAQTKLYRCREHWQLILEKLEANKMVLTASNCVGMYRALVAEGYPLDQPPVAPAPSPAPVPTEHPSPALTPTGVDFIDGLKTSKQIREIPPEEFRKWMHNKAFQQRIVEIKNLDGSATRWTGHAVRNGMTRED